MRECLVRYGTVLAMTLPLFLVVPSSYAEWYAGLYGGYSNPTKLRDVQMPMLGQREASTMFPFDPLVGDTLTSSLSTSDIALKSSGIFGGKAGYYFKDEGFSWLGVEVEAFTTTPTIKQQTVTTTLDATFVPKNVSNVPPAPPIVPASIQQSGTLQLEESRMRMITVAFNVVARYPGEVFQPYVGAGVGAFYFSSTGQIDGHQVVPGVNLLGGLRFLITQELGFFLEGKYNRATITNLDPNFGLSGEYSAFHGVAGLSYHF